MARKKRPFTKKGDPWQPTDAQLLCRDLQHSWTPSTARLLVDGYLRILACTRCKAFKTQKLSKDGYILNTTMTYPAGYLRPGEGRLTRSDRAELRVRNI